jgi:transposase
MPPMKYIGLDAHSGSSFYVIKNRHGRIESQGTVATTEKHLLDLVRSIRRPRKIIFEEGVVSQWLYLLLKNEVDELVVCKPPERRGAKTDRVDANQLADDLRQERYVQVFHSDHSFMELRDLVSAHVDVTQQLTRTKNRYRALYRQSAIATPDTQSFYQDESFLEQLTQGQKRIVAQSLLRQMSVLLEEKKSFEKQFAENVRKDAVMKRLTTIPGIGDTRANQIVATVVTPARFEDKYHFFAYAMLVKHPQTSNGRSYGLKRAIGQSFLKGIFFNAAISALRSKNAFRRKHDEMIQMGSHQRAARQAVARAIAATVLGVWKKDRPYNDKLWEEKQKQTRPRAVQNL